MILLLYYDDSRKYLLTCSFPGAHFFLLGLYRSYDHRVDDIRYGAASTQIVYRILKALKYRTNCHDTSGPLHMARP